MRSTCRSANRNVTSTPCKLKVSAPPEWVSVASTGRCGVALLVDERGVVGLGHRCGYPDPADPFEGFAAARGYSAGAAVTTLVPTSAVTTTSAARPCEWSASVV